MHSRGLSALVAMFALLLPALAAQADDAADAQRLASAERAVAAKPGDVPLRFALGVVLMDLRRDAEALAVFERLTEDFPELADPYNNIALLQARAGRLEAARDALQTALRNDPSNLRARANLGDVYLHLALQAWQAAASAAPTDAALQRKLRLARELAAPAR